VQIIEENKEYDMISRELKEKLGLDKSTVAIKFILGEEDIPEGIDKIEPREKKSFKDLIGL
jgi:uncharacterized protein (DUF169 family)